MCSQSHPRNQPMSSSPARSSGATPRSEIIVRAPSMPTSETTTPFRPSGAGPTTSTPRVSTSRVAISPAGSLPRLPTNRASAPSVTAHAATFAAWPPAQTSVCARRS